MFNQPCKAIIERMREAYPDGTRVKLLEAHDSIPAGSTGTTLGVNSIGDVLVRLDTGLNIKLIYGVDTFEKLTPRALYKRGDKVMAVISRNSVVKRIPAIIKNIDLQPGGEVSYLVEYSYNEANKLYTDWISETSIFGLVSEEQEEQVTSLFTEEN